MKTINFKIVHIQTKCERIPLGEVLIMS